MNDKHSKLWLWENEEEEEVINSQFYELTELSHPKLICIHELVITRPRKFTNSRTDKLRNLND